MQYRDVPSSVVGVVQANDRRRHVSPAPRAWPAAPGERSHRVPAALRTALAAGALATASLAVHALDATPLAAQARAEQVHRAGEPEGRLLAYYSATMVYSPLGAVAPWQRWSVGIEATWLPSLSEAQRRPGIDKPETTNLSPVLPRPRVSVRTGVGVFEASWVPPITVADAKANLVAAAVSRTVASWRGVAFIPRLSAVTGRVEGAITCNAATAGAGDRDLATYYAAVCHGNDSDDWFEPRIAAVEIVAARGLARPGAQWWVAAGGRIDRSRFDIGVRRADGSRDPDHPILRLRDTRPHVAAGARWPVHRRILAAGEWFYAPGSVATLRALVSLTGGRR